MSEHRKPEIKPKRSKFWIPLLLAFVVITLVLVVVNQISIKPTNTIEDIPVAVERPLPVQIDIESIGASSSLIQTGLNADGTIEVPDVEQPLQASWYNKFPIPGEAGPAIILGHVNGNGQRGVFARLSELEPGDSFTITLENSVVQEWIVYDKRQVPKDDFPTDEVYNITPDPEIRLITCGGVLDRASASYKDNIIVYARLRAPPTESN